MGDCMVCELHLKKMIFFKKSRNDKHKKDEIQGSSDCGKWEEGTLRRSIQVISESGGVLFP